MTITDVDQSQISAGSVVVTNAVSPNSPGSNAGAAPFRKPGRPSILLPIPPAQICKVCGKEKPLKSFHKSTSNRSGRTNLCHTCRQNRPHHQAKLKSKRENGRPDKVPCPCGNSVKFRWWKGKWECVPCFTIRSKENDRKHRNEHRKSRKAHRRVYEARKYHGEPIALALDAFIREGGADRIVPLWKLIRRSLPSDYNHLQRRPIYRIMKFNRIAELPKWNVGWKCFRCQETSFDHRFFDLDHLLPRHKKGSSRKENLQILCPNCHRRKTLCDLWGSGEITPNELDASTPNRADANSLNNTPNADSSALCGVPGTPDALLRTANGS